MSSPVGLRPYLPPAGTRAPVAPGPTGACERTTSSAPRIDRLFVPLDTSPASAWALNVAIVRARVLQARIVVLALHPGSGEADDDGSIVATLLRDVLLPAQARVEAAGVAVERRALPGPNHAAALRDLVFPEQQFNGLVLCSPLALRGPLWTLTTSLLLEPPCTVFALPSPDEDRAARAKPGRVERLLRRLTRRSDR